MSNVRQEGLHSINCLEITSQKLHYITYNLFFTCFLLVSDLCKKDDECTSIEICFPPLLIQSLLKLSLASRMVAAAKLKRKKKNEMAVTVRALILMQMESQASRAEAHPHPHKQHPWLRRDVH